MKREIVINIKNSEIEFTICESPTTRFTGDEVGVSITHLETGIAVKSIKYKSQHKNKLAALELLEVKLKQYQNNLRKDHSEYVKLEELKMKLVKSRFENSDKGDLIEGSEFFRNLEEQLKKEDKE